MNSVYHIEAPTYEEFTRKLQEMIDREDPATLCSTIEWKPCSPKPVKEVKIFNSNDVCNLCDDIESYVGSAKESDTRTKLAERIIALEEFYNTRFEEQEDVDDVPTISEKLQSEPYKVLQFVEGLGMDIFDLERECPEAVNA